jgi:hypothetical protein
MLWGDESPGRDGEFTTERLPGARYLDPEQTLVLGVGAVAPAVDPVAGGAGLVDVEASGGASAWKRRLSPRHKGAVKTFFSPDQ